MSTRRFSLASLLLLTACTAIFFAAMAYNARVRAQTKATYDAQKDVIQNAVGSFCDKLTSEGWQVTNGSTRLGGSGEWRTVVDLTCTKLNCVPLNCRVNVMGFVSHDNNDRPTWRTILPMRITPRGKQLDDRFIEHVRPILEQRGWRYSIESGV